mgnify:CR=1 FL=1
MKLFNNVNQFVRAISDSISAVKEIGNDATVLFDIEFKEDKDYNKQNGKISIDFDDKIVGLVFKNEDETNVVYASEIEFSYLYSNHELGNKAALSMRITSEYGTTWQERLSVGLGNPTVHAKMKALHDVVTNTIIADLTGDEFDFVAAIKAADSI